MPSFSTSDFDSNPRNEFVAKLLNTLTCVRTYHWATDSYAQHVALGEFYDALSSLLDRFVEQYQGIYGRFGRQALMRPYAFQDLNPAEYLMEARYEINRLRNIPDFPQDSALQNVCDEIAGEMDRTIYKLTFLK